MKPRKRTNLKAVLNLDRYGELWLHAGTKIPATVSADPKFFEDMLAYRQRMLDELFASALTDAMVEYYIPVPPMQQRVLENSFGWDPYTTIERRVRMIKPTMTDGGANPVLRVAWRLDPGFAADWTTYIPEYEEDEDGRVRETPSEAQAGDPEPRERAGTVPAPQLPAE